VGNPLVTTVKDIMIRDAATVEYSRSGEAAAKLMAKKKISEIIVTDETKPIGIITEKDFVLKIIAKGIDPKSITVKDFMSSPLVTVSPDTELGDAAALMSQKGIRRLLVLEKERIVGIVTSDALIRNLSKYISRLFSEYCYVP